MEQFIIVCPLVFLAGFVDSIAGGGGLISFPAYMLAGVPVHVTLGTSKLSAFPGAIVAAFRFGRKGYIRWKLGLICSVTALIGAVAGANMALLVDESIIKSMMVVVLPVVAFYVLKNKNTDDEKKTELPWKQMVLIGASASFLIGMYNGFYGPGTGTFLILVFSALVKLDMKNAAGIAKLVNLAADFAAFSTFFLNDKVYWMLGITAALFCMAGSYIGSGLVVNNGQRIVRPVVMVVLTLLFFKILTGN